MTLMLLREYTCNLIIVDQGRGHLGRLYKK